MAEAPRELPREGPRGALHRLFVAVPIPDETTEVVRSLVDGVRLGPVGPGPRWVRLENLHLTLRFLGETDAALVPSVAEAVAEAFARSAAFEVVLGEAGMFPHASRPRTLWLGIEDGHAELQALVTALVGTLGRLGWPPESRPYRPHMTVARTDAPPLSAAIAAGDALARAAAGWRTGFRAERVGLYRSHLAPGGPRYETIADVALAG